MIRKAEEPGASDSLPAPWRKSVADAWQGLLDAWDDLAIPVRGAHEALQSLSRDRLAILANQPVQVTRTLKLSGLSRYFEAILLDSGMAYSKPDPRFYREALTALDVSPVDAVMIGDRLDNDIAPARSLRMAALWLYPPPDDRQLRVPIAPSQWTSACRVIARAELVRQKRQPMHSSLQPTATVRTLAEAKTRLP